MTPQPHNSRRNVFRRSFVLAVFVVFLAVPFVSVHAQAGGPAMPPGAQEITLLKISLQETKKDLEEKVEKVKFSAFAVAYKNALKFFLNTIAIDTATWAASGGKGQKPLWQTKGWNQYLTEVGGGAFGTALDTVTAEWDKAAEEEQQVQDLNKELETLEEEKAELLGSDLEQQERIAEIEKQQAGLSATRDLKQQNADTRGRPFGGWLPKPFLASYGALKTQICNPNPSLRLNIALGLAAIEKPSPPSCTWQTMSQNWKTLTTEDRQQTLNRLALGSDAGRNELSATFQLFDATEKFTAWKIEQKTKEREGEERQGGIAQKEKILGTYELPPSLSGTYFTDSLKPSTTGKVFLTFTGDALADAVGSFTSTLTNKLSERLIKKGMTWLLKQAQEHDTPSTRSRTAVTRGGQQAVSKAVASIQGKPSIQSLARYDYVDDFTACPSDPTARSVFNCVMDRGFATAVKGEGQKGLLSVREAVEAGLLKGGASFGFENPATDTEPKFETGYSYTNIKKLRLARIVPAGWEFAAQAIKDMGTRTTLQRALDCFEDQDAPGDPTKPETCRDASGKNPLYHLVDPNWILKSPDRSCAGIWPSATIVAGTNQRHKVCADVQDCVAEDSDGNCVSWGYCTREKNIFRIPGQRCPAQFDTCQTFTKPDLPAVGTAAPATIAGAVEAKRGTKGTQVNYLQNSIRSCPAPAAGCRWYAGSGTANADGTIAWNATNKKYFNRQVQSCDPKFDGCQAFLRVPTAIGVSSVQQVEQARAAGVAAGRYQGNTEALYLNGKRLSCTQQEVGCEQYTRAIPGGESVTAVLGSGDVCPQECVGYHEYRQGGTNFEPSPPTYFTYLIPSTADTCTAEYVGCDQFTNLDKLTATTRSEATEYFTALRLCEKPAADSKSFDTIQIAEGIGQEPLRWDLKVSNSDPNAPCTAYNAFSGTCGDHERQSLNLGRPKEAGRGICSEAEAAIDADCRRFVEPGTGTVSWRFLSKTITVDPECHPYRKTASPQRIVLTEIQCSLAHGGRWENGVCVSFASAETNCMATGGRWDNDGCIYSAFAPEDESYKPTVPRNQSCPVTANKCREYRGPMSGNVRAVSRTLFDDGQLDGWSGQAGQTAISPAALQLGGKSLRTTARIQKDVSQLLQQGRTYTLELIARATDIRDGRITAAFTGTNARGRSSFSTITFSGGAWKRYILGPVVVTWDVLDGETLEIGGFSATVFFDTIILKEVSDNYYLLKDSWTTPASCDTDPALNPTLDPLKPHYRDVPTYAVGCQLFEDRQKNTFPLKIFSNLCRPEAVGCEALIDTQNTTSPKGKTDVYADQTYDDTEDDTLAFFVNDPKSYCPAAEKGCRAFGIPEADDTGSITYTTVTLRDDPARYPEPSDLCRPEHLGCEAYAINRSQGGETWFFDPTVSGDPLCEWKETPGRPDFFQWFVKGTDTVCPEDRGVKECAPAYNGCTQFYEPWGRTPYYLIESNEIDRSCTRVDWKAGCVLFDERAYSFRGQRSEGVTFNSAASPGPNDPGGSPVSCQPGDPGCDANVILKVTRDRICGEWLQCMSKAEGFDPSTQQPRDVCYGVGRCEAIQKENVSQCAKWAQPSENPRILDAATYRSRDVTWAGKEYSGYSIPGLFPIEDLRQRSYTTDTKGLPTDFRLTFFEPAKPGKSREEGGCGASNPDCTCRTSDDCKGIDQLCRFKTSLSGQITGFCYNDIGVDGTNTPTAKSGTRAKMCRGYPEVTSPFPPKVATNWLPVSDDTPSNDKYDNPDTPKAGFTEANIAQKGENADCSYQKITYQGVGTKYYGLTSDTPSSIPLGNDQKASIKPPREVWLGWWGYCLELDRSLPINGETSKHSPERACLAWWPIDLVQGEINIFNNFREAEYQPADLKLSYYCVETEKQEYHETYNSGSGCSRSAPGCPSGYHAEAFQGCSKSWGHARRRYNCVPDGGAAWYPYVGGAGARKTRMICTKVARIHDETDSFSKNAAWTSRIKDIPQGGFTVSDLNYAINQTLPPYGALKAPADSRPDSAEWNTELIIKEDGQADFQDGSAYAFQPDTFAKGSSRLSDLFAKSYGVWDFSQGKQCVKTCRGGAFHGRVCGDDPACIPDSDDIGSCVDFTRKCYKGVNHGEACNPDKDCAGAGAYCDVETRTCVGGTTPNAACDPNKDCVWGAEIRGKCTGASGDTEGKCTGDAFFAARDRACTEDADCERSLAQAQEGVCVTEFGSTNDLRTREYCNGGSRDGLACGGRGSEFCKANDSGTCEAPVGCTPGEKGFTLNETLSWDERGSGEPPQIRQVTEADNRVRAGGPGFTVERTQSGTVGGEASGGLLPVNLSFYAFNANGQQMPIRRIIVDWGDGTENTTIQGSLKNHKEQCQRFCSNDSGKHCSTNEDCRDPNDPGTQTNTCNALTFGDTSEACVEDTKTITGTSPGYFTFLHVYSCFKTDPQDQAPCVFVPKVQVLDNWGLCTSGPNPDGVCRAGAAGKNGGCFDDATGGNLACSDPAHRDYKKAWTVFNGTVVILPALPNDLVE